MPKITVKFSSRVQLMYMYVCFRYRVLDSSDGLETLGAVNWPILGCLAFIVILCYLIIVKGVKVAGKVGILVLLFVFFTLIYTLL